MFADADISDSDKPGVVENGAFDDLLLMNGDPLAITNLPEDPAQNLVAIDPTTKRDAVHGVGIRGRIGAIAEQPLARKKTRQK